MGKSAKSYKRPTKKEKLGLSAAQASAKLAQVQRHAPISTQFAGNPRKASTGKSPATEPNRDPTEAQSAVEQRTHKLILEAEKRAAALDGEDGEDVEMGEAADKSKKKTGAAGLKQKLAKKKGDGSSKGKDYVDLFEGKKRLR